MSNPIPTEQRELVQRRDLWRCTRCGMRATDWHHRRSRRVRDVHQHCACNGVMLCRTCHSWAHKHPEAAVMTGVIVSQWEGHPWRVPLRRVNGWWLLRCAGVGISLADEDVYLDDGTGQVAPQLVLAKAERLGIVDPEMQIW